MPKVVDFDTLIPVHLQLKDDELLSSWIVRMAVAHAMKPETFYPLLLRSRSRFPTYIDERGDSIILYKLHKATGVPQDKIELTTFRPYVKNLLAYFPVGNGKPLSAAYQWIMPASHQSFPYRLYGLQFCPNCLAEDKAPYFRRRWRFAFVTLCQTHCSLLQDRCWRCGLPIDFRRNASVIYENRRRARQTLTRCYSCGVDIQNAKPLQVTDGILPDDLEFQEILLNALITNEVEDRKGTLHTTSSLFSTLYELATLLYFDRPGKFLRTQPCHRYRFKMLTVLQPHIYKCIEVLNVETRYKILRLVGSVLGEGMSDLLTFRWRDRAALPDIPPIIKNRKLFTPFG